MKPTFHASPVNSPFEDPCLYIRLLRERRAVLFDLGNITRLVPAHLLRVTDVFVTHMHIDHFIGFDMLLRVLLRREQPLRLYGPASIIDCVDGKLRGYTWNLIRDYPLKIEVFEVAEGSILQASFHAEHSFRRFDHHRIPFRQVLTKESLFTVKGLVLFHPIPVMAYSIEEEYHINVNKATLEEMGLPVGPWLSDLKKAIRDGLPGETSFTVAGKRLTLAELIQIVTITRGQKLSYVTDASPTQDNVDRIIPFISGSDTFFSEAYFLEKDRDKAMERNHLTAAMVGRIARESGVAGLELMHFSPKYRACPETLREEAMREFTGA